MVRSCAAPESPETDDDRLLLDGKVGRLGFLGACRTIGDVSRCFHVATVDPLALGKRSQALLTILVLLDGLPPSWWRSRVKLVP